MLFTFIPKFQVFIHHSISTKILFQILYMKQFIEPPQHSYEVGTLVYCIVLIRN